MNEKTFFKTRQLSEAAAIISAGGRFVGLERKSPRTFEFLLEPADLCRNLSSNFYSEKLLIDAKNLLQQVENLKDVLFEKLRKEDDDYDHADDRKSRR